MIVSVIPKHNKSLRPAIFQNYTNKAKKKKNSITISDLTWVGKNAREPSASIKLSDILGYLYYFVKKRRMGRYLI